MVSQIPNQRTVIFTLSTTSAMSLADPNLFWTTSNRSHSSLYLPKMLKTEITLNPWPCVKSMTHSQKVSKKSNTTDLPKSTNKHKINLTFQILKPKNYNIKQKPTTSYIRNNTMFEVRSFNRKQTLVFDIHHKIFWPLLWKEMSTSWTVTPL